MATDLGQLVYTLTLNDEGFQGQLNSATEQVQSSSGEMTGAMQKTEEQSTNTGNAFKGMAAQFVAGQAIFLIAQKSLEILKDSIKDGIQNFEVWQQNQAQINNALKTTRDASGQTTKSLNDYADSLSEQTAISGNAVNSAQLVLLNYKEIGKEVFPQATSAVADFAAVLSHGAVPSQDEMQTAAKLLGRALEDPTKGANALTRAGVTLSLQQQEQIKNMAKVGDIAGAQKLLLDDLANVIGGKAVTASHTLAGEQAHLHAEVEKVQIMIGQKLAEAFKIIEPYLIRFADWLINHKPVLEIIAVTIGILAAVIAGAMVVAIWSAVAGFLALSASMLPLIAVAVAVGIVAVLIMNNWKNLQNFFGGFAYSVIQDVGNVIDWIKDNWLKIVGFMINPVGTIAAIIIGHWQDIKKSFLDAFGNIGTFIVGIYKDAFNMIIDLWDNTMGKEFHGQKLSIGPAHFDIPNLNIPKFADGGIVNSATLALIGESGPEAVVPLSETGDMGKRVSYNFQPGSVILSTKDAVDEFFSIGNRNMQLELQGGSPLAGTSGV